MTTSAASVRPAVAPVRTMKRADIQGLRAFAVTLVITYHFFPSTITGGFVGVDVFFVISGYLITLLLLREHQRTGTISLSAFWARRIRRLMPAALATTAATVAAAWIIVDPVSWTATLHDAAWTSAYLANVNFSLQPSGYFAAVDKSPLLHTWSLAVEEQYYLLWPALLLGLAALTRGRLTRAMPAFLVAVVAASLTASVVLTDAGSPHAYYSIITRAWELALGSGVAYAVSRGAIVRRGPASTAVWVGLAATLAAAFAYTDATPFPGYAALLPTVGTALAIWGGTGRTTAVDRLLSARPVQVIGDASYSLYLWHWPVLILGTEALGSSRLDRIALATVALALGLASHRWIERPTAGLGQHWNARRFLAGGLAVALAAAVAPAVAAAHVTATGGSSVAPVESVSATVTIDQGVITLTRDRELQATTAVPSNVTPTLTQLPNDLAEVFTNGCYSANVVVCEGGDADGAVQVVLTGDSHAGQWWPGLDQAARSNGWKLYMVGKNACPLAYLQMTPGNDDTECDRWQREAVQAITALRPDVILYDNHAQGYMDMPTLADDFEDRWTRAVLPVLNELTQHSTVVAFGQTPTFAWEPGSCLGSNLSNAAACSQKVEAVRPPLIRELSEQLPRETGALYFDPALLLCNDTCPMLDRNAIMYRDSSHISAAYATALADSLGAIVNAALKEAVAD